jgi:hypothetical protein
MLFNFEPRYFHDEFSTYNIGEHAISRLYLRTKPKAQALKGLGIDTSSLDKPKVEAPVEETPQCKIDDPDCLACGS